MAEKKFLNEEILDDEQLEKVAGGSAQETVDDSKFLNVLLKGTKYHQCGRYGEDGDTTRLDVVTAWKSLGVFLLPWGRGAENLYDLNNRQISREEAWAYAEKLVGKHLNRSDWDW